MRMRCRLALLLVLLPLATPAPARAGEFAQVPPAPGMALTLPEPGMANSEAAGASAPAAIPATPQIDPGAGRRRLRALGAGFPSLGGQLPNQRTGSRHEHVVRDICIGC